METKLFVDRRWTDLDFKEFSANHSIVLHSIAFHMYNVYYNFKVYTIVYNSAGRFSTPLKTFSSRRVFRPFIEQGASPPVLWSRGASPPPPGGVFFPGRACQRCNISVTKPKVVISNPSEVADGKTLFN